MSLKIKWVRGAMDNASAYGAEDSRFESWRTQFFLFFIKILIFLIFYLFIYVLYFKHFYNQRTFSGQIEYLFNTYKGYSYELNDPLIVGRIEPSNCLGRSSPCRILRGYDLLESNLLSFPALRI